MKNLNKKIGAMALAVMVVAGGIGLSKASVVYASSKDMHIFAKYNSNANKDIDANDKKLIMKEFSSIFDRDVIDLNAERVPFKNEEELKKYLLEKECEPGIYYAVLEADRRVEIGNRNLVFSYGLSADDLYG